MGRVDGKVALITGAARGIGRAVAERLAEEGADIIALDLESMADDLAQTAELVEGAGRRIVTPYADVRDGEGLAAAIADGIRELGRLDIVVANAGINADARLWEMDEQDFQRVLDVNLTGVWRTLKATVPQLIARGSAGSVILIGSVTALRASPRYGAYSAAKRGVSGLMQALVNEASEYGIRVNVVAPTIVDTAMIQRRSKTSPASEYDRDVYIKRFTPIHALPVPWVKPVDVANASLFLASEEARYVTGQTLAVDAGFLTKYPDTR